MPKLNSVITSYNSFKRCCVFLRVLCFEWSLLPDRSNPCHLAPNLETRERWPPYQKTFFCFDFSQLPFLNFKFNVFVFYHLFVFFHCRKQNAFDKSLINLAGGKYIYGQPNFIYAKKKTSNALQRLLNEL